MTTQKTAKLRTCASCEWIFRNQIECPKCGFGSYGARYVYGDIAYSYELTQKPWFDKKIFSLSLDLWSEIEENHHKLLKNKEKENILKFT